MKEFKGLMTPMITVFDKNDEVSVQGLRDHINFLLENGIDMIFTCGSTGEFSKLSDDERKLILRTAINEINGKVPVFAGTAADSTKDTIMHSKYAQDAGADGVIIIPPYYCKVTEEGLYQHFKAISEKIDIPIMLYNNPARSMIDVQPELIARLGDAGYISYVKESTGDIRRCTKILKLTDKVGLFQGIDTIAIESLIMGATGWISSSSNVIPRECVDIYNATVAGNLDMAKELFSKVYPLFERIESGLLIGACKGGLRLRGREVGLPRMPILRLTNEETNSLKAIIEEILSPPH